MAKVAALLAGVMLWAGGPGPTTASAQAVHGSVVGADDGLPLAGAEVRLLDTISGTVDRAVADSAGRFTLGAEAPGRYLVHVAPSGYLSYSRAVELRTGAPVELRIEMPVVSEAAAVVMREAIDREAAFQLPWEELCGEPVRPWEAGVLVGVSRDRRTMEPVPRAVIRAEVLGDSSDPAAGWTRTAVATATGAFWFCNVPPGRVRVTARAAGYALDTWEATVRAGTISWYDALLR